MSHNTKSYMIQTFDSKTWCTPHNQVKKLSHITRNIRWTHAKQNNHQKATKNLTASFLVHSGNTGWRQVGNNRLNKMTCWQYEDWMRTQWWNRTENMTEWSLEQKLSWTDSRSNDDKQNQEIRRIDDNCAGNWYRAGINILMKLLTVTTISFSAKHKLISSHPWKAPSSTDPEARHLSDRRILCRRGGCGWYVPSHNITPAAVTITTSSTLSNIQGTELPLLLSF